MTRACVSELLRLHDSTAKRGETSNFGPPAVLS